MALLAQVERYLRSTGTSATRFGREVAQDPCLVTDMRGGREPRGKIRNRILHRIGDPGRPAAFVRALGELAATRGLAPPVDVGTHAWVSVGYTGEQVTCRVPAARERVARLAAALPDHEWRLPFLVADVAAELAEGGLNVTALLLPFD